MRPDVEIYSASGRPQAGDIVRVGRTWNVITHIDELRCEIVVDAMPLRSRVLWFFTRRLHGLVRLWRAIKARLKK